MNSKLLKAMVSSGEGGMKSFAKQIDLPYTTLYTSLESDERLNRMPIENFKKVAAGLGMTIDQLDEHLSAQ